MPIVDRNRRVGRSARRVALALFLLGIACLLPAAAASAQTQNQEAGRQLPVPIDIPGLEQLNYDTVSLAADGRIIFSGYVDIDARPAWRLQADEVAITQPPDPDADDADWLFEATGNVAFESGAIRLNGSRMTGNLRGGTGVVEDAWGIGPGDVYFRGERIEQRAPGTYHIEKGIVTPCTQALPIWEFSARSFDLVADDHVTMTLPVFRIKGVPMFVLPAMYWPIDEDRRSTGFLLPSVGTDTRKGFMYGQPFFWAINRSMDATVSYDYYSKARSAFSAEYRHTATANAIGNARFFWAQGSNFTDEQLAAGEVQVPGGWTLDGEHNQNLGRGWGLIANASFFSSQQFVQGFEDDFNRFLRRESRAGLFLSRNWDSYTLNLVADHNETFFQSSESVVQRREPEIEFRVRQRPLYEPLYVQFQGSAANLRREERSPDLDPTGGLYRRIDALPEASLAFNQIPWLTFTPFLSWRSTYYSERRDGDEFIDDPIFRNIYRTGIDVTGPSIFRIFDTPNSEYSPRYKHVLEPRFRWERQSLLDSDFTRSEVIQFDEIDPFGGDRETASFSLTNRLLAKRFNTPNDDQRTVWEVLSVELSRQFDLSERDPSIQFPTIPLPWAIRARFTPTPVINVDGSVRFTPQWSLGSITLNGSVRSDRGVANVTWFRNASTFPNEEDPSVVDVETSERLTGSAQYNLFSSLVTARGNLTWDVSEGLLQAYTIGATWNTQCCSIGGQLRQNRFSFRDDLQFSILVELLNVGSLGFGSEQ